MSRKPPRLYVQTSLCHKGQNIELLQNQGHYLKNVLRLSEGSTVLAFDGISGEWESVLRYQGKKSLSLTITGKVREQENRRSLELFFAPIKPHRLSFLIEKAVELDVGVLHPILTEHTAVRKISLEKMKAQVIEACEQSERLTLPEIHPMKSLQEAVLNWGDRGPLLLCDERRGGENLMTWASSYKEEKPIGLLIGPEGGFSQHEFEFLDRIDSLQSVHLGRTVLRSETAALVSLSVLSLSVLKN